MITRRSCLKAGALGVAGLFVPLTTFRSLAAQVVEVRMWGSHDGAKVGFDPIGLYVEPGQTVRWILDSNVHTTTAYHPKNGKHSLRIPEAATSWDSDYLVNPGEHFDVTLTVEGVYDYYCTPHEQGGMVGRIVCGHPGGPGTLPFDYFTKDPAAKEWLPVPVLAAHAFPKVEDIVTKKIIRL
ncbi:hypothetical protein H0A58_08420 [Alcaligenaceae bacterium]|nr:hypothetical protein [Alcaligenaceae bacterium]